MKRTFFLVLSLCLVLSALFGCSSTQNPSDSADATETTPAPDPNPISDFEYEINDDGNVTITQYLGESLDVVLPSTIDGKTVTEFSWACFSGNRQIISVYLPDTITVIPHGAFNLCGNLTSIRISPQTARIGNGAFEQSGITQINLPHSLTEVGMRAFYGCANLKSIIIPPSAVFDAEAFAASGLETVVFEDGVEIIGYSMFTSTNLKFVTLPSSVKTIGVSAFSGCPQLETVILNQGLTQIGTFAFADNGRLTEIVIPSSVTDIQETAFMGSNSLQKVKFDGNAPKWYEIEDLGADNFPAYTVFYHEGAEGFTTPEWFGYPTEIW